MVSLLWDKLGVCDLPVAHAHGERVGVATDVIQEVIWAVKEIVKHLLVLEHLIRDVGPGDDDVEKTMSELAHLFVILVPDIEYIRVPMLTHDSPCWSVWHQ